MRFYSTLLFLAAAVSTVAAASVNHHNGPGGDSTGQIVKARENDPDLITDEPTHVDRARKHRRVVTVDPSRTDIPQVD
ncbi:hypothetical protein BUE80_DR003215 [Diplocarpon rosae]|nr:hypothetical protein BUE80_DR003215 [Diplocarpon rosae]